MPRSLFLALLLGVSFAALGQPSNILRFGEELSGDNYIVATNGAFFAQAINGSLCVFEGSGPNDRRRQIWCSPSVGGGVTRAKIFPDNDLCVSSDEPVAPEPWCTHRTLQGFTFLLMNGDGNLFQWVGTPPDQISYSLWQTGTVYAKVAIGQPPDGAFISWSDGAACPPDCARNVQVGETVSFTPENRCWIVPGNGSASVWESLPL